MCRNRNLKSCFATVSFSVSPRSRPICLFTGLYIHRSNRFKTYSIASSQMLQSRIRSMAQRALRSHRAQNVAKALPVQVQRACFSGKASGYESDTNWNEISVSELTVETIDKPSEFEFKPTLLFGERYSDHMLEADWTREDGWEAPRILPFHMMEMHPASSCLHYGVQCFEGLKVYRGVDDKLRMFRPMDHAKRFAHSCVRMTMPAIPPPVLVDLMCELIRKEARFVPKDPGSMYLRPTMIGTVPKLGVTPPGNVKFFTICNPCGAYFKSGLKPMSLLADPAYVRAWHGSAGGAKVGPNYGPVMLPQLRAHQRGYTQPMWLAPDDQGDYEITECGTLNLFILWKCPATGETELVTAPKSDLILPGINRLSVIEMVQQRPQILNEVYGHIKVSERVVKMSEFVDALDRGLVYEFFGTGTASNVVSTFLNFVANY